MLFFTNSLLSPAKIRINEKNTKIKCNFLLYFSFVFSKESIFEAASKILISEKYTPLLRGSLMENQSPV